MSRRSSWWRTLIGVALTGIMLFPLYWMINVSVTQPQDLRRDPPNLFPANPTFAGYSTVISEQLPYLGTSLLVGLGTVALTLALSAPAAFALAKLRHAFAPSIFAADSSSLGMPLMKAVKMSTPNGTASVESARIKPGIESSRPQLLKMR